MANDRTAPYGAFNFLVSLGGNGTSGGFAEVTGLGQEFVIAEYRNGNDTENHVRKQPGLWKASDVTLKRGVLNSKDLWDWIKDVREKGVGGQRDSVVITLLDETRKPVQKWTLKNVLPLKYTGPNLNGKGGTDVAMEELVLSSESIKSEEV